jgi:hypothetical protein
MIELFDENFGLTPFQIMRNLSTQLGANFDGGEIKILRGDKEYLMYIYGSLSSGRVGPQSFFEIKTKIPYSHPFFGIRKSNSLDWVAENILSMPDYQIGDTDFDSKFYIKVSDNNWGNQFFSEKSIKSGITELLSKGFDLIRSEDGDLKAIKYLSSSGPYPKVDMINNAIGQLDQIITDIPDDYICATVCGRTDKGFRKRLLIAIFVLLILGATVYWPLVKFTLNHPANP